MHVFLVSFFSKITVCKTYFLKMVILMSILIQDILDLIRQDTHVTKHSINIRTGSSEVGFFTTSKTDHHLLRQKVPQRISVMKTNTGGFCCLLKTKPKLKWQFS